MVKLVNILKDVISNDIVNKNFNNITEQRKFSFAQRLFVAKNIIMMENRMRSMLGIPCNVLL